MRFQDKLDLILKGKPVDRLDGEVEVLNSETQWRFRPDKPWRMGNYELRVAANLEDVAGNSLRRPFEVALDGGLETETAPRFVDLEFRVAPGPGSRR